MKRAVLIKNGDIKTQRFTMPKLLDDKCRIKVHTAGICSSDIHRGFGNGAYFYPLVMGHEIAGHVVECGKKVNKFFVNDAVSIFPLIPCKRCNFCMNKEYMRCNNYNYYGSRCDGGFAQFIDVNEWNLVKIPKKINLTDAALLEPMAVCVHALERLQLTNRNLDYSKKKVAVLGAGFLGLIICDILKYYFPDLEITLIDRNESKLNIAKNNNINTYYLNKNSLKKDFNIKFKDYFTEVIEATGTSEGFITSINITKPGCKTLWMGNITTDLIIEKNLVSKILRKELNIIGTWNSIYQGNFECDWSKSIEIMKNGYKPSKLISHIINLEQIGDVIKKMFLHKKRKKHFDCLKVVVKPNKEQC